MTARKVHITFDYELFFGGDTGTAKKCILEPTAKLIELAESKKVKFIFFVDAGYLCALRRYSADERCASDLEMVGAQVKKLHSLGHEIGLHVHPHWEDCRFENGKWLMDTSRYKLSDFSPVEISSIVSRYHSAINEIISEKCYSFRAGGWCIQPFSKIKKALEENGIYIDSSVFRNGFHEFTAHSYDFTRAPDLAEWNFEDDECRPDPQGRFREIPITPDTISPFFYFDLYLKMKMNPAEYRPIGDGSWLKDKRKIYRQFYSSTRHFACCDGYFASRLVNILQDVSAAKKKRMVVLGHPKSLAASSYKYLSEFIDFAKTENFNVSVFK